MEEKRDTFVIYRSFYECLEMADDKTRLEMYDVIMQYGFNHVEPNNLTGVPGMLWRLMKPNLEATWINYTNGKKGGRPRKDKNPSTTETKPTNNQTITETKPKRNRTQSNKDKDKDVDVDKDAAADKDTPGFAAVAAVENKDQSLEERKNDFYTSLIPFKGQYGNGLIQEFFNYYSQTNNESGKMRFEADPYFNVERILAKWKKNQRPTNKSEIGRILTNTANKEYKQEW